MRVAYVLRYFPALTETFVLHEVKALRQAGHEVVVVSMGEREDSALVQNADDVPVLRMPRGVWRVRLLSVWLRGLLLGGPMWPDLYRLRTRWTASRLRALEVERLHVHFAGEAALWSRDLASELGVPYTVTVHAVDLFKPVRGLKRVLDAAERVITVCDHHATYLSQRFGVHASVVRMGVAQVPPLAMEHTDRHPLRVVSVGRYVPKKGMDLLISVAHSLADSVELRLVGDAPIALRRANLSVGPVPHSQIAQELRTADVFVLPCRVAPDGDRDGIPVALMEAMAEGLPVVSTRVAGIPELVDNTVGWLIEPDDPDELRRVLREAMRTSERVGRGHAGRAKIVGEDWTVARQAREMLQLWGFRDA